MNHPVGSVSLKNPDKYSRQKLPSSDFEQEVHVVRRDLERGAGEEGRRADETPSRDGTWNPMKQSHRFRNRPRV